MSIGGKPGGSAPLAMMWRASMCRSVVSKYWKLPVVTLTAPTDSRTAPELSRSKSTSRSSERRSGSVS